MIVYEIERAVVGESADPAKPIAFRRVQDNEARLTDLLANGWEPFAVTPSQRDGYVYHFRRLAEAAHEP
jgi:hypothetical protein